MAVNCTVNGCDSPGAGTFADNSVEGDFDGFNELGFAERFPEDHSFRPARANDIGVPTDEHVRKRPRAQNFVDGRNAASPTQARIDDHQVWPGADGGTHGVGFGSCYRADLVAHSCEQFA